MKKIVFLSVSTLMLLSGCNFTMDQDDTVNYPNSTKQSTDLNGMHFTLNKELFNKTKVVNGKSTIQNPNNILVMVNKQVELPNNYIPSNLVRANVKYSFGNEKVDKALMKKEMATALEKMFQAANQQGLELLAVSGYRSYSRQTEVFNAAVAKDGKEQAEKVVAVPGQSEHQTGLTMDISSQSNGIQLEENFEDTPEGKWLANNAHLYGFIMRYPKGKESITGYDYEPWHFRYVGNDIAKTIYENKLTLEEFIKQAKAI